LNLGSVDYAANPFKSASELQRTTELQASCIGKGNRMKFSLQQVIATAKGNKARA
jgi:hypothetical protein